jgi:hypothetical protein
MIRRDHRRMRVLCLLLGLLAVSCNNAPENLTGKVTRDRLSLATPRDRYADDLGRFLAGLPSRTGSRFGELEKQPAWISHRRELDRAWTGIEEASLPEMRAFQKQELSATSITGSLLF